MPEYLRDSMLRSPTQESYLYNFNPYGRVSLSTLYLVERLLIAGHAAKFLLDPEKLIVLRHAVAPAGRARLDLPGIYGHGQIGDEGIFRLAGTVGNHCLVPVFLCHLYGIHSFADCADLVHLHQNCIGHMELNARIQPLGICDKQVISHELDLFSQFFCHHLPAIPVILRQPVLDGNNGITFHQFLIVGHHLLRASRDLREFPAVRRLTARFIALGDKGACGLLSVPF